MENTTPVEGQKLFKLCRIDESMGFCRPRFGQSVSMAGVLELAKVKQWQYRLKGHDMIIEELEYRGNTWTFIKQHSVPTFKEPVTSSTER